MCANCGCQGDKAVVLDLQTGQRTTITATHQHASDDDHHSHNHDHHPAEPHEHDRRAQHEHHDHYHTPRRHSGYHLSYAHRNERETIHEIVDVEARILAKNDAVAEKNRVWFAGREILALNLVSSPGAGKTTLLERTIRELSGELPLYVIEGDQATANDGERIRAAGAAVVQINTGTGCHLDAQMVTRALAVLKPARGAVVLIENVGNLVCPALFDLGERAKVIIFSVTDGEDKPLKYPHMFRASTLVILHKVDLLPHLDFSLAEATANVRQVNPEATILEISSRTGEGLTDWYNWLRAQSTAARQSAFA